MKTPSHPELSGKATLGVFGLCHSAKRDRKSITLHVKLEVLWRFEEGEKLTKTARALGLATSTVASIRVNKDKIRASSQAVMPLSVRQLTRCRGVVMGHMECLLSLWIEEQKRQNLPVSMLLIQDKTRRLFAQLQHKQGDGTQAETFGASNGWFARFKARHNEFWRSYTITTAVDHIAKDWAELPPSTMNSAWRKLWPECIPSRVPEPDTVPQLHRSIVALASHVGLGDVAEADVTSLLLAHGEPRPLASPRMQKLWAPAALGFPGRQGKSWPLEDQSQIARRPWWVLIENDPYRERSLPVSQRVHSALAHLQELNWERRQQTLAAAS
ncbi:hypothetical protein MC885_006763 [Smutsia gigantea]|nr:hypothetical protein MC885_006763 [Smutsia gigantea]